MKKITYQQALEILEDCYALGTDYGVVYPEIQDDRVETKSADEVFSHIATYPKNLNEIVETVGSCMWLTDEEGRTEQFTVLAAKTIE